MIGRRGFLIGMGALIAAPAIVRVTSIMPVRSMAMDEALDVYGRSPALEAIAELQYINEQRIKAFAIPFRFMLTPPLFPRPLARAIVTDAVWLGMPGGQQHA